MVLEALRRAAKEYDAYILRAVPVQSVPESSTSSSPAEAAAANNKIPGVSSHPTLVSPPGRRVKLSIFQQAIRALLHMLQFAVAYFVM